jgi:predicted secreted protein
MQIGSALAIYVLFWTLALFLVMPFHVRTAEEMGEKSLPGHAESAPHHFPAGRIALRTTMVSAIMFALFYANYSFGWVTADMLDWTR